MTVELIYNPDCPNLAKARTNLLKALAASGRDMRWSEWDRMAAGSPSYVRGYGSPTILIDGKDVAGAPLIEDGSCCRLYGIDGNGFAVAPPVAQIAAALAAGHAPAPLVSSGPAGWKSSLAATPGIGFAFIPKLACPACWPAYAGLLSSLGLGFLLDAAYMLPLTAAFLAMAVGALAFRARTRRGYGPFAAGLAAAAAVLTGKFIFDSGVALYGGVAMLIAASVWNAWPARNEAPGCPAPGPEPSSTASLSKEASS